MTQQFHVANAIDLKTDKTAINNNGPQSHTTYNALVSVYL